MKIIHGILKIYHFNSFIENRNLTALINNIHWRHRHMVTTHNLGFPRIGSKRQLKFALEKYWRAEINETELMAVAQEIKTTHLTIQSDLDYVPVGDFSLYDHVLDTSFLVGNIPERATSLEKENTLETYFKIARGQSVQSKKEKNTQENSCCNEIRAGEMTKWFDTNYHYIVPEFELDQQFSLNAQKLLGEIQSALKAGHQIKPVLLGPVTYLYLGKSSDATFERLDLLDNLLIVYSQLLSAIKKLGVEWVQIDEPILVTDISSEWSAALKRSYDVLSKSQLNILLATYFGELQSNLSLATDLAVQGLHIDARGKNNDVNEVLSCIGKDKILSLGVVDGRNIWVNNLLETIDWLEPIYHQLGDKLWLAPSCSLLHVPIDLDLEFDNTNHVNKNRQSLDSELLSWMAFAKQKVAEIAILGQALNQGRDSVKSALEKNQIAIQSRSTSHRVYKADVQERISNVNVEMSERQSTYDIRERMQSSIIKLPEFPTTTIGSFPQTSEIRTIRNHYKQGLIDQENYEQAMFNEIDSCIDIQEDIGLDVLVHGEAERNDMVEYFGEQLDGYAFSQFGWVQSYGSRCVKPPIIYGDIRRAKAMTVKWAQYAQSKTNKYMKGMLTGPVTMLNWSFVRDDLLTSDICLQLALAIRDEVQDLEKAGIKIIQIDEAALREGLPLRKNEWEYYLNWSKFAFKIAANGVKDITQIHTHMCYSEFNDIIESIADLDADVITIETSRSNMELLQAFEAFDYPNSIGPGVYDIHSPNIPSENDIIRLLKTAQKYLPSERIWVNPDCGLKTRNWQEVKPALINMVNAAKQLRYSIYKAA